MWHERVPRVRRRGLGGGCAARRGAAGERGIRGAAALLRELARTSGGASAPKKFGVLKLVKLIKWRYETIGIDVPNYAKGREANRALLAALWDAHAPADLEASATEAEEAAGSVAGASSSAAGGGGDNNDDFDGDDEDGDEEEDALAMDVAELARRGGGRREL